ncbi:MAG TPA: hypothetical protein PLS51_03910 [Flavobacterium sp.]|nr:hypothetical protein [Flavobacterium sp.]HPJ09751.1 hypothetical protein [Flavobacterium sp.]
MIINRILLVFAALLVMACQNDDKRLEEQARDAKAKELIFSNINKGWNFATPALMPKTQAMVGNWTELRLFLTELNEKPQSSIGAFQKKAKALSKKAKDLTNNIPAPFNKPQIKARIAVLTTKINSINLYINLDGIPDQKVIANVVDANEELAALYREFDETVRKSEIPKEEGEADMIRMLDTARAIPNTPPPTTISPMQQMQKNALKKPVR